MFKSRNKAGVLVVRADSRSDSIVPELTFWIEQSGLNWNSVGHDEATVANALTGVGLVIFKGVIPGTAVLADEVSRKKIPVWVFYGGDIGTARRLLGQQKERIFVTDANNNSRSDGGHTSVTQVLKLLEVWRLLDQV